MKVTLLLLQQLARLKCEAEDLPLIREVVPVTLTHIRINCKYCKEFQGNSAQPRQAHAYVYTVIERCI